MDRPMKENMKEINDINEIHNVLFDSLCYFDDFCSKNELKYFISNGTLLGAAKYRDFIPWDDDADILMPRKDYDRLMSLTDINNGKYRLLCKEQSPNWRMPYSKLSNDDTLIREEHYDFGVPIGLSVDIFPIDKWSPYLPIAKIQSFRCECLKRLLVCSIGGNFSTGKKGIKKIILWSMWHLGKMLGYSRIQKKLMRIAEKSKKRRSKYAGCIVWTCHLNKEIFPAELFKETTWLYIQGKKFPAMGKYESYLSKLYGDWKAELPEEKRCSNHRIKAWWNDAE